MSGKRRVFVRTLVLFGILLTIGVFHGSADAAVYPDIEGHWAQPAIERWSESGILKGHTDGTFGPNDPVTRAQLAEILYRIWGCGPREGHAFLDVPEDAWYHDALVTMNAGGVALNQGKYMYPDELLTREEAFYMVAKTFRIGADTHYSANWENATLVDADQVDRSFWNRIAAMFASGYLNGKDDGAFHPKDTVTRAEVITVIDNMFDVCIYQPGSYLIEEGTVALVLSSGVTLVYEVNSSRVTYDLYLFAEGSKDIHFMEQDEQDKGYAVVNVYGFSEDGIKSTDDGEVQVSNQSRWFSSIAADLSFGGGVGIARCPYLIETPEHLMALSTTSSESRTLFFSLENDIVLPGTQPYIYQRVKRFRNYLHGNGRTITYNFVGTLDQMYNDTKHTGYGLFLDWYGTCRDLTLEGTIDITLNENYTDEDAYIGAFSNRLYDGEFINCTSHVDITVTSTSDATTEIYVGGFVGYAVGGRLENCISTGSISLSTPVGSDIEPLVGGIVGCTTTVVSVYNAGDNDNPEYKVSYPYPPPVLSGCGSTATVSVDGGYYSYAGGIVGNHTVPESLLDYVVIEPADDQVPFIENCWSAATVSAFNASFQSNCGGIVGAANRGIIRSCWAAPTIMLGGPGVNYLNSGSIAGAVYKNALLQDCWGNAQNCPVSVDIFGQHFGGIVGRVNNSEVANCYAVGTERLAAEDAISFAFWTDTELTDCIDLTRAAQEELEDFFSTCGWDFETVWDNSGIYPILRSGDKDAQRLAQTINIL